jgi:choline/glycine/proline betaine transport protein
MCYSLVVALRNEKKRLFDDRLRLQAQDGSPHLNLLDRIGPGN